MLGCTDNAEIAKPLQCLENTVCFISLYMKGGVVSTPDSQASSHTAVPVRQHAITRNKGEPLQSILQLQ